MLSKNRVIVGMSGGVDSTVAAKLLKEQGYEVIGVSLRLFDPPGLKIIEEDFDVSNDISGFEDAKRVCDLLDIPHYVISLKNNFKKTVVNYFGEEYKNGRTPNPCVVCNKYIKFGDLLKIADTFDSYYLATGHYIKVENHNDLYKIKMADSDEKDQTYMMYNLTQDIIKRLLMPLGSLSSKDEVREIASNFDVKIGKKTDSQEICFVPNDDYISYLKNEFGFEDEIGDYLNSSNEIIGKHKGIFNYTIGQRKGLGMSFGKPMFVLDIDANKNKIVLGDNEDLFSDFLIAEDCNFIYSKNIDFLENLTCKVRYSAKHVECNIRKVGEKKYKVMFKEKQRAITPGQSVVFYDGRFLFGGGVISKSL